MKTKPLLASLTALASCAAFAQEDRRPEPPRPPEPPAPPARPTQLPEPSRPPDAHRPPHDGPGSPESRRPVGPRDGDRPREDRERRDDHHSGRDAAPPRGEHREDGGPRRPDRAERPDRRDDVRPARPPMKPMPFLGVMTEPLEPALSAQLGLAEGFGLVVREVVPDSPAARAGVQRHDVLARLDDQRLTDPNQLAALVRSKGRDAEVSLAVIRQGAEQKLTAKIAERPMPERRPLPLGEDTRRNLERMRDGLPEERRQFQERMEKFQRRMREFHERLGDWQKNPSSGPAPQPPQLEAHPPHGDERRPRPIDILREARPGGAREMKTAHDGQTTTWNTAQARVFVKDESGELELSSENGRRQLTARDAHGARTFSGPIDTEEQRRALSEDLRRKLEKIDARTSGGAHGSPGGPPAAAAEKTPPVAPVPPRSAEIQ